eukprot:g5058.t1
MATLSRHRSSIHAHQTGEHGHHSTPSEGKLLHSAFTGDHTEVVHALEEGVNVNCRNEAGETPLHHAAAAGQLHIAQTLIERGADIDARDHEGETPLHNSTDANHPHMTEILLKAGADVHAVDKLGWTPLHNAAGCGDHSDIVEQLLRRGADPMLKNNEGMTPKDLADEEGHEESSILLGAVMAAENSLDMGFNTSFSAPEPEAPKTPEVRLCHAAYDGDLDDVLALLGKKVDPNCRGEEQNTPLHRAAQTGRVIIAKKLLAVGADPKKVNKDKETPLHLACDEEHPDMVQLLISAGSDIDAQDHLGWTAIHNAVGCGDFVDLVKLLVAAGANPSIKNNDGHTPLQIATDEGHLESVEFLKRL